MDIYVKVFNQKLRIANNNGIVAGTKQFVRFLFELSEEWAGLIVFVQFMQNDIAYNVYLDEEDAAYLPPEIQDGPCTMALYGANGTVIAITDYIVLNIKKNNLIDDDYSESITPTLYEQLVEKVDNLLVSMSAQENDLHSLLSRMVDALEDLKEAIHSEDPQTATAILDQIILDVNSLM